VGNYYQERSGSLKPGIGRDPEMSPVTSKAERFRRLVKSWRSQDQRLMRLGINHVFNLKTGVEMENPI
jgi:hypothetical protein